MEKNNEINQTYINGSFLIHLYDKLDNDGNSYFCPQIKLEQLLIIANLEHYKKYKEKMNDLNIIYENNLGYYLDTSTLFFRSPITISRKSNNASLSESELSRIYPYKESNIMYFDENQVKAKSFETLINIFIKFASYSPRILKEYLTAKHEEIEEIFENIDYKDEFRVPESIRKYNNSIEFSLEYMNHSQESLRKIYKIKKRKIIKKKP